MNNNNITKLINNIVYIEDKNTESKIKYSKITCDKLTAKCSNTKIPIFKLKIDDKLINRNNSYRVKYKCINCEKKLVEILAQAKAETIAKSIRKENSSETLSDLNLGCDSVLVVEDQIYGKPADRQEAI